MVPRHPPNALTSLTTRNWSVAPRPASQQATAAQSAAASDRAAPGRHGSWRAGRWPSRCLRHHPRRSGGLTYRRIETPPCSRESSAACCQGVAAEDPDVVDGAFHPRSCDRRCCLAPVHDSSVSHIHCSSPALTCRTASSNRPGATSRSGRACVLARASFIYSVVMRRESCCHRNSGPGKT